MAGRQSTPRWRFPVLVVTIGAIVALLIAFSNHPIVQWLGGAVIALAGVVLYVFPTYLTAANRTRDKHQQAFRQRRFRRWQKHARSPTDGDPRD